MALSGIISELHNRGVGERCGSGGCTRYCADMCVQPQLAEVKPHRSADFIPYSQALIHKLLRLPRNLRLEGAAKSARGGSHSVAPATKSARGGSQSAVPATTSARQETSENSNHNGGTDRRQPATGDNRRQRNSQSL